MASVIGMETAGDNYGYVYLLPAKNYSKKLVFLYRDIDGKSSNNVIQWVKLIDLNEELKPLNSSEAHALEIIGSAADATTKLSNPLPLVVPPGNDIFMEFFGSHPNAENNTTITNFINTYGISVWGFDKAYEKDGRYRYDYVYPASNYSKQLVYLEYRPDSTGINSSIIWVKLIDKDEKLALLSDYEARALGIDTGGVQLSGFTQSVAIVSIAIIVLIVTSLLVIKRKR